MTVLCAKLALYTSHISFHHKQEILNEKTMIQFHFILSL